MLGDTLTYNRLDDLKDIVESIGSQSNIPSAPISSLRTVEETLKIIQRVLNNLQFKIDYLKTIHDELKKEE